MRARSWSKASNFCSSSLIKTQLFISWSNLLIESGVILPQRKGLPRTHRGHSYLDQVSSRLWILASVDLTHAVFPVRGMPSSRVYHHSLSNCYISQFFSFLIERLLEYAHRASSFHLPFHVFLFPLFPIFSHRVPCPSTRGRHQPRYCEPWLAEKMRRG